MGVRQGLDELLAQVHRLVLGAQLLSRVGTRPTDDRWGEQMKVTKSRVLEVAGKQAGARAVSELDAVLPDVVDTVEHALILAAHDVDPEALQQLEWAEGWDSEHWWEQP